MNSVDMATNLIFRAKNLQEFTVTTEVPEDFAFHGVVPRDWTFKTLIILGFRSSIYRRTRSACPQAERFWCY